MKEIIRVAFAGKMGGGKTTAANLLEETLRQDNGSSVAFVNLKFADPIYQVLGVLHQWQDANFNKPRQFMQRFGDITREEFGDDIFERLFEESYFSAEMSMDVIPQQRIVFCVDDVRFQNELILLKNLGFYIIGMECPDGLRQKRTNFINPNHRSEIELDDLDDSVDMKIVNDGSEEDLREILKMVAHFNSWSGDGFTKIEYTEGPQFPEEDMSEDCGYNGSCDSCGHTPTIR